jgi:hypothetical protein
MSMFLANLTPAYLILVFRSNSRRGSILYLKGVVTEDGDIFNILDHYGRDPPKFGTRARFILARGSSLCRARYKQKE